MVKLIAKWIKQCFSGHFTGIVAGNLNRLFNRNTTLYDSRIGYCNTCDKNVYVSHVGRICDICGCPLKSKLRAADEHCDLNKW